MNFIYKILQNLRSSIDKLFLEPYNKSANSKGAAENPAAPFSVSLIMKIPVFLRKKRLCRERDTGKRE